MRCQFCGGSIVRQARFGPYPERLFCLSCGREPILKGEEFVLENEEVTKICQRCKTEKPIDEFGILNSSKDGHSPICFECRRKKTSKTSDQKRGPGRPTKTVSTPVIVKREEPTEKLFADFREKIIQDFLKSKLIPMLEGFLNG
jgi:hypothetical protein